MKKYRIQRVDPKRGVIYQRFFDNTEMPISTALDYFECMAFISNNQKELKPFRISEVGNRKNARRHLNRTIYAVDKNEAIEVFDKILNELSDDFTYELLTGDWQMIAIRRPGQPIILQ